MATDVGDLRRLVFNLTAADGVTPVNANTMTLTVTLPDGTVDGPHTVTPITTGQYQYDYLTVQAGRHAVHWSGTGTNPGAMADAFDVVDPAPEYMVSLDDAKTMLKISPDNHDEDDEVRSYIESATAVAERLTGRAMVRRTITEEHEIVGQAGGRVALNWTPVVSLVSLVLVDNSVTWDPTALHVNSDTGVVSTTYLSGLLQLWGRIQVVYVAGYIDIPANYQLGAKIIIKHLWQVNRGAKGAPRPGGVDDTTMLPGFAFAIPNRALELFGTGMPGFA